MRLFNLKSTYTSEISLPGVAVRWLLANTSAGSSDLEAKMTSIHVHIEVHLSGRLGESFNDRSRNDTLQLPAGRPPCPECSQTKDPHIFHKELHRCLFLRRSAFSLLPEPGCVSVEFLLGRMLWEKKTPLPWIIFTLSCSPHTTPHMLHELHHHLFSSTKTR